MGQLDELPSKAGKFQKSPTADGTQEVNTQGRSQSASSTASD
jgi:hypothetical protein